MAFIAPSAGAQVNDWNDPALSRPARDGVESDVNRYDENRAVQGVQRINTQIIADRKSAYVSDATREGSTSGYKLEYLDCTKTSDATILKMSGALKCGNQEMCVMPVRCTIQVTAMDRAGKQIKHRLRGERTAACLMANNKCPDALECMKEKVGETRSESDYSAEASGTSTGAAGRDRSR